MINLFAVPDQISDEAAVFTEPLAAAYEILDQTSLRASDRVLLIGAGRLGQLIAAVIHQVGCELDVVARHSKQRELLVNGGITVIHGDTLGTRKYDVVVEATGSTEGFEIAAKSVRPRGRIILKSTYKGNVEINFSGIVVNEIILIGSRCGSFEPALDLLAQGKIDPRLLIDSVFSLEQGMTAIKLASRPGVLKVLVQPGGAKIHTLKVGER